MMQSVANKLARFASGDDERIKSNPVVPKEVTVKHHEFSDILEDILSDGGDHSGSSSPRGRTIYKCDHPYLESQSKLVMIELEMTLEDLLKHKGKTHIPVEFKDDDAARAFYLGKLENDYGWYPSDDEKSEFEQKMANKQLYVESLTLHRVHNNFPFKWGVSCEKITPQMSLKNSNALVGIRPLGDQTVDYKMKLYEE